MFSEFFIAGNSGGASRYRNLILLMAAALLVFIAASDGQAAISFVQQNYATPQSSQASVAVIYTTATLAGDTNIVAIGWSDSTSSVSTVKDTKGNTYVLAIGPTRLTGVQSQVIYVAKNVVASAANQNTVTVTFNVAVKFPDVRILSYRGLDPVSPVEAAVGSVGTGTTSNSGSLTTSNANDLLFAANYVTSSTTGAGSGFTSRVITIPDGDIAEDRIVTAAGSYSATASMASGSWVMQLVALKAAGSQPTVTTPTFNPAPGTYSAPQTVHLSDTTAGATIYYTVDGSTPTTGSTVYNDANPIQVNVTTTINAIAAASGFINSAVATGLFTIQLPTAATPTFNPAPATYSAPQTVHLLDTTAGATIYYTVNGSTPTTSSTVYNDANPIQVNVTTTIKAIAAASGFQNSAVATGLYTIQLPTAATPTFNPAPGTYTAAQTVHLLDTTSGATIYYTLDGSTPTTGSTVYNDVNPIHVSVTTTIKAIAAASGFNNSAVATGLFTIQLAAAATPTFNPAPGTYTAPQTVHLLDTTSGATIYYTLDGSTPTTSSTVYNDVNPIQVSVTTTIKAIAAASGFNNSAVATGLYTIQLAAAATPTFNPAPGTYTAPQTVHLLDTTSGATIYYTLDGSTPTTSSTVYNDVNPIQVNVTTTIKAIAAASGFQNSAVATGLFTIQLAAAATPTFNPAPGSYTAPQTVHLLDTTSGAIIYYTLDGSTPTTGSAVYNDATPIQVSVTTTIKAIAAASGFQNSAVATGTYIIGPTATIAFVQMNYATPQTNQQTVNVVYTGAQTAGNTNIVAIGWSSSTLSVTSVTDTKGNSYVPAIAPIVQAGTQSMVIFVCRNIVASAAGSNTVTVNFNGAVPFADVRILEYSGLDPVSPLDGTAGASGNSATSSSGAITTTNANDLIFAANYVTTNTSGPGSGFVSRVITIPDGDIAEDRIVTATGTYTPTASLGGSGQWLMQAIALRAAGAPSTASPPTFNPTPGTYATAQTVHLSDTTPGATIYYTIDGSTPTTGSTVYNDANPIQVNVTTTIKAIAGASGFQNSAVATGLYTIQVPTTATPTFNPAPGTYTAAQTVHLLDTTPASTIYYTLDGSTPTTGSTIYNDASPIQVNVTTTIKAIAAANGFQNSAVATGLYTIQPPTTATPTFNPAPGTYATPQSVHLLDTTPGATIYYTLNGTTPTTSSTVYNDLNPIQVPASGTTTIKAIAAASGFLNSAVATGIYNGSAADPSVVGQWSSVMSWPILPIHVTLMPTGKVLAFGHDATDNTTSATVWDPSTNTFQNTSFSGADLFCAGHGLLPDGRVFIAGGHNMADYSGLKKVTVFDPTTLGWSSMAQMNFARWYPTVTALPDGRMLVSSGAINCDGCNATIPEIYNPVSNSWTQLTSASLNIPIYPHMFVLPDGRVLNTGSYELPVQTRALNINTQTWTTIDPTVLDAASAVMYLPGKILKNGTSATSDPPYVNAAATSYVLDMTQGSPAWRTISPMNFPRSYHNLTVLPDGNVLVTGGIQNTNVFDLSTAVLVPEMWSPTTESYTKMAAMQTARVYHSHALLLPDGRVLVGGGGHYGGAPNTNMLNAEIYSPPYLFKGARPSVTAYPSVIQYGTTIAVQSPDANNISSVALIRLGSVTHAFNENQRFVPLSFTKSSGTLSIQTPANGNIAPPGHYMLFIVNSTGVPSVGVIVQIPAP